MKFINLLSPQDVDTLEQACALVNGDKDDTLLALLRVAMLQNK